MKSTRKILSLVLMIMFALSFAMPPLADAAPGGPNLPTDVVITKVQLTDLEGWPKTGASNNIPYNGGAITDLDAYFGSQYVGIMEGVAFRVYQGTDATGTEVAGGPFLTDENGQVTIPDLPNGTYYFVEDKAASTYVGDEGYVACNGTRYRM